MSTSSPAARALFLVAASLVAGPASAASDDEARAERLFQEAKTLMAEGRAHEACPKLEEARRLDAGGGTVLALALCYEQDGRGATALAEFRKARALAAVELCGGTACRDAAGVALDRSSSDFGLTSTIAFGAGAAALVGSLLLLVTSSRGAPPARVRAYVAPLPGGASAGAAFAL